MRVEFCNKHPSIPRHLYNVDFCYAVMRISHFFLCCWKGVGVPQFNHRPLGKYLDCFQFTTIKLKYSSGICAWGGSLYSRGHRFLLWKLMVENVCVEQLVCICYLGSCTLSSRIALQLLHCLASVCSQVLLASWVVFPVVLRSVFPSRLMLFSCFSCMRLLATYFLIWSFSLYLGAFIKKIIYMGLEW